MPQSESPPKSLAIHYLPQFVGEADQAGATVVVIDLLRASTTICSALAAGAASVRPFLEVGEVIRAAEQLDRGQLDRGQLDRGQLVLGGERGGEIIPGFDLGNSPAEYSGDVVFGKQVLFTTTNGTAALRHARLAERIVVGAMVNLSAVVEAIADADDLQLLCAGTNGHVTREDRLAAGAIAHQVLLRDPGRELTDPARRTLGEWQELLTAAQAFNRSASEQLAVELRDTQGGKNLIALDMQDDLPRCAQIDKLDLVPIYDPQTGAITAK